MCAKLKTFRIVTATLLHNVFALRRVADSCRCRQALSVDLARYHGALIDP